MRTSAILKSRSLLASQVLLLAACTLAIPSAGYSANWPYDFGTGTGSYTTNGASTTFLPAPSAGTARVRVGSGGGGLHMENPGQADVGAQTELRIVAPTGTSVNKFSIYDYTPDKTFWTKFTIKFNTASSGTWLFFQGDGAQYSDNNAFAGAQVFSGLQWLLGSGTITTSYRNAGGWSALAGTPFAQNTAYAVEIVGNNSTASVNYSKGGTSHSVASNTWDLWINGVLVGNDLAKGQLANDVNIDSLLFYGASSAGNVAEIYLDDFTYGNAASECPVAVSSFAIE